MKASIDLPSLVLAVTMFCYWGYVGVLSHRKRRRTRRMSGIVPSQPLEKLMWLVWVPLVLAWMTLPWLAAMRGDGPWALPAFAREWPYLGLRWLGALVGVVCLRYSLRSWRRMGRNWRMAVAPGEETELVTTGPFAYVRHPIYALSILLMLCTLVVVPTPPLLLLALLHIGMMIVKARNEERFLADVHGAAYADYCRRTGRFVPRLGGGR